MKVQVNFELCQSHGTCEGEAPEVFHVDEQGFLQILQEQPAPEHHEAVRRAARYCPTQAISLLE